MTAKVKKEWQCPHCTHMNTVVFPSSPHAQSQLVYCDSEDGGCDARILLDIQPKWEIHRSIIGAVKASCTEYSKD